MTQQRFPVLSRILHWSMAAMIIAMLFIGIGMMSSLADYHWLVSIHKPLGIAILVLVTIRLGRQERSGRPDQGARLPVSAEHSSRRPAQGRFSSTEWAAVRAWRVGSSSP
jgi:cytochrome b561